MARYIPLLFHVYRTLQQNINQPVQYLLESGFIAISSHSTILLYTIIFFWSPKAGSGHSCGVYQTHIMSSCTRPLLDCPPIVFYSSLHKAKIMAPFRQAVNQPSRLRCVVAASFFLISRTHVPTHLLYLAVTGRSKSLEKIVSYSQTTLPLSYELKLATKLPVINGPLPLRTCWFMYVSAIADAVAFKY